MPASVPVSTNAVEPAACRSRSSHRTLTGCGGGIGHPFNAQSDSSRQTHSFGHFWITDHPQIHWPIRQAAPQRLVPTYERRQVAYVEAFLEFNDDGKRTALKELKPQPVQRTHTSSFNPFEDISYNQDLFIIIGVVFLHTPKVLMLTDFRLLFILLPIYQLLQMFGTMNSHMRKLSV